LPDGYQRYVLDLNQGTRITPGRRLTLAPGEERRLKVILGSRAYAESESDGASLSALETDLRGGYPNPFTEAATIEYVLSEKRDVTLEVYNVLGQRVRTLVSEEQDSGLHRVQWNGENQYGERVGSGVYFYRIEAGSFTETRKLVLVR
jgi:flagellar hook assembly protein FlgD